MTNMTCRRCSRFIAVFLTSLGLLQATASGGELTESLFEALRPDNPAEAYVVRSGLGHSIGDGVGYDGGFSSFNNFIPLIEEVDRRLLFADVHLLTNNQAAVGGNLGFGHRIYDADANRTWGVFAWYDFRETQENWFHQMTIGFETLGEYIDIRSNVYVPDVAADRLPNPGGNYFTGNQLVIADEAAMTGFDFEAGTSLVSLGDIVTRGYSGFYFLRATGSPDTWGWRYRTELEWTDRLLVNFGVQEDDIFGRTATVGITIHSLQAVRPPKPAPDWPIFNAMNRPADSAADRSAVASRLAEPTRRFRNIMIHRQERVAADPATGALLSFLHVVPGGSGDGKFETPHGTFAAAMTNSLAAGSRIYTPQGGSFSGDFTLVSGTELVSSSRQQHVATQGGRRYLPRSGFTAEAILAANVTVNDKTRLDGFTINGQIKVIGRENVTIHRNLINPLAGQAGISLTSIDNAGDLIVISENTITGGDFGIDAIGPTLDLDLLNNTILDAAIEAIRIEATGTGTSTWIVSGNSLSGTGAGDVTEAKFINSGGAPGTVGLTLTGNSSANNVPDPDFNFDLSNSGGGGFTLQQNRSNWGSVGSFDGTVTLP